MALITTRSIAFATHRAMLWVGTYNSGINLYSKAGKQFQLFQHPREA